MVEVKAAKGEVSSLLKRGGQKESCEPRALDKDQLMGTQEESAMSCRGLKGNETAAHEGGGRRRRSELDVGRRTKSKKVNKGRGLKEKTAFLANLIRLVDFEVVKVLDGRGY